MDKLKTCDDLRPRLIWALHTSGGDLLTCRSDLIFEGVNMKSDPIGVLFIYIYR